MPFRASLFLVGKVFAFGRRAFSLLSRFNSFCRTFQALYLYCAIDLNMNKRTLSYCRMYCTIINMIVLGPSLYGTKTATEWIITQRCTHFCGFHPPYTNKKNKSDFIVVGPDRCPISNKNGSHFCWLSWPTKMKKNLKIPSRSQICTIESCISTTVLERQHRFVNDDTVQKCILRLNNCLAVSGFTTVISTFAFVRVCT